MTSMTDAEFTCWLAGFFDGEGCIYLSRRTRAIELSIANTDKAVIEFIQSRLARGTVTVVTYSRPEWKTKYHWRLRNLPEAFALLTRLRPYLKIKGAKADEALGRCADYLNDRKRIDARNAEIIHLVESGMTCVEVSKRFGLSRNGSTVSLIVRRVTGNGSRQKKAFDIRRWRRAQENTDTKHPNVGPAVHTRSSPLK